MMHSRQRTLENQEALRQVVLKLVERRKESIGLIKIENPEERNLVDILINTDRQTLIEHAKQLITDLGEDRGGVAGACNRIRRFSAS